EDVGSVVGLLPALGQVGGRDRLPRLDIRLELDELAPGDAGSQDVENGRLDHVRGQVWRLALRRDAEGAPELDLWHSGRLRTGPPAGVCRAEAREVAAWAPVLAGAKLASETTRAAAPAAAAPSRKPRRVSRLCQTPTSRIYAMTLLPVPAHRPGEPSLSRVYA